MKIRRIHRERERVGYDVEVLAAQSRRHGLALLVRRARRYPRRMRLPALMIVALVLGACGDDEAPAEETCAEGELAEGPIPETGDAELDACADRMEDLEGGLEEILPRITGTCVAVAGALGAEDTWSSEADEVERMKKACAAASGAEPGYACEVEGCLLAASAEPGPGQEAAAAIEAGGPAFLAACGCGGASDLPPKTEAYVESCFEASAPIATRGEKPEAPSCAEVALSDRGAEAAFRALAVMESACAALLSWGCSSG